VKAIVLTEYGSVDALRVEDVPKPVPESSEVLIKTRAFAVNDWDWCLMRGSPFYIRLMFGWLRPKVAIPGVDVAGVVETVGRDVTRFRPGDAVYGDLSENGFGAFAEYVCADEGAVAAKPAGMSFVQAAALPHAAMLAIQGLRDRGRLEAGQALLINGAGGGVGTLGLQIAKAIGVEVTGVDSTVKLETMRALGFDHVIDYTREDFTRSGRRYDLILDTKTNRSVFRYLRALNPNGRYVTVGGHTGRLFQTLIIGPLIRLLLKKEARVLALEPNKDLNEINTLFEAGGLDPVIDGPYELADLPEVMQRFGEGRHHGKLVISLEEAGGR
jgi:NADPH:quinone reductase-like Zn-dependent oxidoreductase